MNAPSVTRQARLVLASEMGQVHDVLRAEPLIGAGIVPVLHLEARPPRKPASVFLSTGDLDKSLLYVGHGIIPIRQAPGDAEAFAAELLGERYSRAAIHGLREPVLELWDALGKSWQPLREVRDQQLLLVDAEQQGSGAELANACPPPANCTALRRARPAEFNAVLPAAAAMHAEELGTDPLRAPVAALFRHRVMSYLHRGCTWVMMQQDRLVFKADVVAQAFGIAVVQGVWTSPGQRGRGVATYAMTQLLQELRGAGQRASLVVNESNIAAATVYRRCGMHVAARYATILP